MRRMPLIPNPFAGLVTPTPVAAPAPPAPPPIPTFVFDPSMLNAGVTISWLNNFDQLVSQGVDSSYCATEAGALAMQQWLAANGKQTTIFQAYPLYPSGVGNLDPESQTVPWLTDGVTDNNAGLLIVLFRQIPIPSGGYIGEPYSEAVTEAVVDAWSTT
jgi:hypothetical protein